MKKGILFVLFLFTLSFLSAIEIKGVGRGKDEGESKRFALSDLSSFIEVEVQSKFESIISEATKGGKSDSKEFASTFIKTKSELPVLGVEYKTDKIKSEFYCEALLDASKVLRLYEEKLFDIAKNIENNKRLLAKSKKNDMKISILRDLIKDLNRFNKFKIVAVFLESKSIPEVNLTEAELKNQILELSKNIDSIDSAAKKISDQIKQTEIYIYPPTTRDSKEITQFASVFKDNLSKYLKTTSSPDKASYYLRGNYEILKNGIDLTCRIMDPDFNVLGAFVVRLLPAAYEEYEFEPKSLDFTKVLEEGLLISNDFKIDVRTNFGKEDLLFKAGEEVEIFVKMNKPGYFYGVGHVDKKEEKFSYVLEINSESDGGRKFIYYMSPDYVNKWVSIGVFEACYPFGLETLQLIASNKDLVDSLPGNIYDADTGYYVLSSSVPAKNVVATRGLKPKKSAEVSSSENILLFTTIEK